MNQSMQQSMWCKATLQYPTVNQLPLESVGDMLNKASNLATTANFQWSYIDKPADGSIFLVYIQNGTPTPPDGFMYMDNEQPYSMNVGGKMIEIWEHKYGFVPGQEHVTSRSRRRFRLGGKNPSDIASSLWLLFYSRTGEETRVQANPMQARPQPIRKYPLPAITTKPFNLFQAVTGGAQMPNHQQQMQQQYQAQQLQQLQAQQVQQAQQAQAIQAAQAAALQAQQMQSAQRQTPVQTPQHQQQQNARPAFTPQHQQSSSSQQAFSHTPSTVPQKRPYQAPSQQQLPAEVVNRMQRGEVVNEAPPFDDSNGDEFDYIQPIDISKTRFIKHQEWMEEIFSAYPVSQIRPPSSMPASMTAESLAAQLKASKMEMERFEAEHEAKLQKFRDSTSLQVRLRDAISKLGSEDVSTAEDVRVIESTVGLKVLEWQPTTKIST